MVSFLQSRGWTDRVPCVPSEAAVGAVLLAVWGVQVGLSAHLPLNHPRGIPQCIVQTGKGKTQGPVSNAAFQGI